MPIINGYCTLVEVKAALRLTDTVDDSLLERSIEGASRRVDGYCGRFFYKTESTPIGMYPFDYYNQPVKDIANTTVTVKTDTTGDGSFATTWTQGTDYQLEPLDASITGVPYNRVVAIGGKAFAIYNEPTAPFVQVTAQWGWNQIPSDIREATVLLSIRGFARLNAALGIVGFNDMAIQVKAVDPDVRDLLNPYRLLGIA